jgi:hypothetical protein
MRMVRILRSDVVGIRTSVLWLMEAMLGRDVGLLSNIWVALLDNV